MPHTMDEFASALKLSSRSRGAQRARKPNGPEVLNQRTTGPSGFLNTRKDEPKTHSQGPIRRTSAGLSAHRDIRAEAITREQLERALQRLLLRMV